MEGCRVATEEEETRKGQSERERFSASLEEWEALQANIMAEVEAAARANDGPDEEAAALALEEAAIEEDAAALQKRRDRDRELAKFTANALDRASTSLLTLGLIGPGVGFLYHTSIVATLTNPELVVATISCLGLAIVLHFAGRAVLSEVFLR